MKKLSLLVLAAATALAMPAQAATVVNQAPIFNGTTGYFAGNVEGLGNFASNFGFNVGTRPGTVGASITSISVSAAKAIADLTVSLNGTTYPITSMASVGNNFVYKFGGFSQTVPAGNQTLIVRGSAAAYSSSFATTVGFTPAVPEPASWALMIGGFALVGGMARRRNMANLVTVAA